jgi:hypothetical protein
MVIARAKRAGAGVRARSVLATKGDRHQQMRQADAVRGFAQQRHRPG